MRRNITVLAIVALVVLATPGTSMAGHQPHYGVEIGRFEVFADAHGTARGIGMIARGPRGTRITVIARGLEPNTDYRGHLHFGGCTASASDMGAHYKDDLGGADHPPNELHFRFTTNARGGGSARSRATWVARPEARSLVIHRADGSKLACAEL